MLYNIIITAIALCCAATAGAAGKGSAKKSIVELVVEPAGSGTVIGSGTYGAGNVVNIQARPAPNYYFARWGGNVVNPTSQNTRIYASEGTQRLIAYFEPVLQPVRVTIEPAGSGTVTGSGYQPAGQMTKLFAQAAPGFVFDAWIGDVANPKAAQTSLRKPLSGEVVLAARFKPATESFALTTSASPPEGGTVTRSGMHARGAVVKVQATPAKGYMFNGWTGPVALAGNKETTVYIAGDTAIKANFVMKKALVVTKVLPEGAGLVEGKGLYPADATVPVTATAASGYRFLRWDGPVARKTSTQTTVTATAESPVVITAIFERIR